MYFSTELGKRQKSAASAATENSTNADAESTTAPAAAVLAATSARSVAELAADFESAIVYFDDVSGEIQSSHMISVDTTKKPPTTTVPTASDAPEIPSEENKNQGKYGRLQR